MLPRLFTSFLLCFGLLYTASVGQEKETKKSDTQSTGKFTLEELFPKRGPNSTSASGMEFSFDGRYAAYLYRPYSERMEGNDLWIFDTKDTSTKRVTSLNLMAKFQELTRRVKENKEKRKAIGKKEEEDEDDKKEENKIEKKGGQGGGITITPRYVGISNFTWSPVAQELLFTSAGDIYRWKVGDAEPTRLTHTKGAEVSVQYLPDGKGYTYRRGDNAIIKVEFGSSLIQQIDPLQPQFGDEGRGGRPDDDEQSEDWPQDKKEDKKDEEKKDVEKKDEKKEEGKKEDKKDEKKEGKKDFDQKKTEEKDTAPVISPKERLSFYELSPDGKKLLLMTRTSAREAPDRKVSIASYRDRFMKVNEVPRQVSEDPVPPDETHIYLYDIGDPNMDNGFLSRVFSYKTATPRDLISRPNWSLDSQKITFSVFKKEGYQVEIYTAEMTPEAKAGAKRERSKPAKLVYKFQHNGGPTTPDQITPEFLDDNRRIVFLTELSGFKHLHLLDPVYEALEQVTTGKCEINPIKIAKDHKSFFVSSSREHSACQDIYQVMLADRSIKRLTKERGVYTSAGISPDGKHLLANYVRFGLLTELVHVNVEKGEQKTLTDSHPESQKKITKTIPEFFSYPNRHGQEIQGYVFKPDNWSKNDKRPLLIYVYGGPLGSRLGSFGKNVVEGYYQGDGYFFAQYMAKTHGYVCCTIDPRGMSGYGALFEKSNFQQVGKPQVEDLVDGVKHMIANYGVDPKKVGIHGWSFGGFQTQMCLYTEPEVFQVGIAGAGPTEWENYNAWYSTGTIDNSRPGQPDLSKYSLLPLAKNLKGHLMLVHGMEDSNVLYQDTIRVYRELLKANKAPLVELFLDPTGGHGLGGDVDRLQKAKKYEAYLLQYLGKGEASTPPQPKSESENKVAAPKE